MAQSSERYGMKREPKIVEFKQSWHDEYLKHGVCHDRSGSTKQELTGIALQQFILKKMGRTWDDVGNERATIEDIDCVAIDYFPREVDETSYCRHLVWIGDLSARGISVYRRLCNKMVRAECTCAS